MDGDDVAANKIERPEQRPVQRVRSTLPLDVRIGFNWKSFEKKNTHEFALPIPPSNSVAVIVFTLLWKQENNPRPERRLHIENDYLLAAEG